MLHTKLYMKEKFYFFKKYEKDLEKDVYYEDILLDFIYTNKRTGNKALILLNGVYLYINYYIS